jgi:hypothetical protein
MEAGGDRAVQSKRTVHKDQAEQLARKWGARLLEISAKTSENVELSFNTLIRYVRSLAQPGSQVLTVANAMRCGSRRMMRAVESGKLGGGASVAGSGSNGSELTDSSGRRRTLGCVLL